MAIIKTIYSKNFISQTAQKDISEHGSAIWEDYQERSEEDNDIRKNLIEQFAFHQRGENDFEGFDGKNLYKFYFQQGFPIEKDKSKNGDYKTEVIIRKAGAENDICFPSDLEKCLMKNGFKQLKNQKEQE